MLAPQAKKLHRALTDRVCDKAHPAAQGTVFYLLRDPTTPNLALRVTEGGTKTFVWEGRVRRRPRRITIGRWPGTNVAAARRRAHEIRAAVDSGRNPADERLSAKREITYGELFDRWLEEYARPQKRSWKTDEQRIRDFLAPWRRRQLSDLSAPEVARLHVDVAARSGNVTANRVLTLFRAILRKARDEWRVISGPLPTDGVKPYRERSRERYLRTDEARRVLFALEAEVNPYWRAFFKLSLLLGTRRNELLGARWCDIDFEAALLAIPKTKTDQPHVVPLPAPAIAILAELPRESEFLFPGSGRSGHLAEPKKAWRRVCDAAAVNDVRIHDLRRTVGSWLVAQGYSLPLIGKVLGHRNQASTAIYSRLDLAPVREALESNARQMLALVATPHAEGAAPAGR